MATSPHAPAMADRQEQFGTVVNVVSLLHDAGSTIELAWRKVNEYRTFDSNMVSLLIRLARNVARFELWCKAMGYRIKGTREATTVTAMTNSDGLDSELQRHLQKKRLNDTLSLSLRACIDLLKQVLDQMSSESDNPGISNVDNFLDSLPNRGSFPADAPGGADLELGEMELTPSTSRIIELLRRAHLNSPSSEMGRAKQVLKNSLGTTEGLMTKLENEVEFLESFMMGSRVEMLAETVPPRLLEIRQDTVNIQATVERLVQISDTRLEGQRRERQAAINSLLSMRPLDLVGSFGNVELTRGDISIPTDGLDAKRFQLEYDGSSCILEWYDDLVIDVKTGDSTQQLRHRLGNLVHQLTLGWSEEFRVLSAIRYLNIMQDGKPRYGLLYELPRDFDQSHQEVVSLETLLEDSDNFKPALGDRFRLALLLCQTLRQFQTSQWLHEKISSQNIIFLVHKHRGSLVSLEKPFITGFGYSRHFTGDSDRRPPLSLQRDHYQHPERRRQGPGGEALTRYRAEFDIYSLGRVLLEIAEWEIVGDADLAVDEEMLQAGLADLPSDVGSIYAETVRWCVGGTLRSLIHREVIKASPVERRGPQSWPKELIEAFEENVLMRLADCRA